jgi:hypothetical protein
MHIRLLVIGGLLLCLSAKAQAQELPALNVTMDHQFIHVLNESDQDYQLDLVFCFWSDPADRLSYMDKSVRIRANGVTSMVSEKLAERLEKMDNVQLPSTIALSVEAPDGIYSVCLFQRDESGELTLNAESSRQLTRTIRTMPGYMPGLTAKDLHKVVGKGSIEENK